MIYLFCLNYLFGVCKYYINSLTSNYNFIKLIIIESENDIYNFINYDIINQKIDKNIYIYINYVNDTIISIINNHIYDKLTSSIKNKFYLININSLINNINLDYLTNINFKIINFNSSISNLNNKILDNNIYVPYLINNDEIYSYDKVYDIAIIGIDSEHKRNIYNKLKDNNINVNEITNLDDDLFIFSHKILINMYNNENYTLIDETIIKKCLINKLIIISEKTSFNYFNDLNKYIFEIQYNLIVKYSEFVLNNYDTFYKSLYNDFNITELKDNLKTKSDVFFDNLLKQKDKFGFIIVRHVNSQVTNNYWIESYKCIRKQYDNKIIIIDDNSNYDFISKDFEVINCEIVNSEFKARGEILGYYYLYKNKYFEKAVIIHDSVFINKYIDFEKYDKIKFLWHFTHHWDNEKNELGLLNKVKNNTHLRNFYFDKNKWHGCFGVQSVISYNFLEYITNKYNIFNLIYFISNRPIRMNFERIFGLICSYEVDELQNDPSIFGIIHHYLHWGYTFDNYLSDKDNLNLSIIKVWTGR